MNPAATKNTAGPIIPLKQKFYNQGTLCQNSNMFWAVCTYNLQHHLAHRIQHCTECITVTSKEEQIGCKPLAVSGDIAQTRKILLWLERTNFIWKTKNQWIVKVTSQVHFIYHYINTRICTETERSLNALWGSYSHLSLFQEPKGTSANHNKVELEDFI